MKRKVGTREVRVPRTIVVACDGARTEADYFRAWKQVLAPAAMTVRPFVIRSGGNPLLAVRSAAKEAKRNPDFAEFWCVCDVDNAREADVTAAQELAQRSGIQLCLSRRCFEVWLALHWERSARSVRSEAEAIQLVRRHVPSYAVRSKAAPFRELYPRTLTACDNADWLRRQGLADPSTDVDRLVRKLHRAAGTDG